MNLHLLESTRVFVIGDVKLIRLEEHSRKNCRMMYLVTFKDCEPNETLIDEGIELLRVFAQLKWDFELKVDMRMAQIFLQVRHITSYTRLINMIRNDNCKHCTVLVRPLNAVLSVLLHSTIYTITNALDVKCSIQEEIE
jgi:hypothetical protein